LLAGPRVREQMGRASLEIVGQRFSAERIMPIIEGIYQNAVERQSWSLGLANGSDRVGSTFND